MHAIHDFLWREDAFRAVIVASKNPACFEWRGGPGDCDYDTEKVSGYTSQDVINAANAKNISLFMLNINSAGDYQDRLRGPFQAIAEQTDGWYTEEEIWPMLHALKTAFDAVADKAGGQ
jgi:hypothetical protein